MNINISDILMYIGKKRPTSPKIRSGTTSLATSTNLVSFMKK